VSLACPVACMLRSLTARIFRHHPLGGCHQQPPTPHSIISSEAVCDPTPVTNGPETASVSGSLHDSSHTLTVHGMLEFSTTRTRLRLPRKQRLRTALRIQTHHVRHTRVTRSADISLGCARCTGSLECKKPGRCSDIIQGQPMLTARDAYLHSYYTILSQGDRTSK
jgi:hypothetical protein